MAAIHATAVVDPGVKLGTDVKIGPLCVVGAEVELGDGVELVSHVVVDGRTSIGARTRIFPFATIGLPPQDLKYEGEPSRLEIGADNRIREHVTMNPGTQGGGMLTKVGDGCLFMVGSHVAHDCKIGDRVIMANNATLAGHVEIDDDAILGGLSAIHQFVRIGRNAMIGGMSGVEHDVIPYGLVMGERARLNGLNIVGLKRHGFSRAEILALQNAYKLLFGDQGTIAERLKDVRARFSADGPVGTLLDFADTESPRALCQPKPSNGG